jgi:hypothetical protein
LILPQTLCLTVLSLVYFIGMLLKTETVETGDRENVGWFMIMLLITILLTFVSLVAAEVSAMRGWAKEIKYAVAEISSNPVFDPSLQVSRVY